MPATVENTPYLHNDENLQELTSREMISALEKSDNRKKVRENMQALLSNEDNKKLVKDLRNVAAHAINVVKNDDDHVKKLLSLRWSSNGTYRWNQEYPDGTKPTAKDRAIYGVLCLYDQLMYQEQQSGNYSGPIPSGWWKGRWLFTDAQFWLKNISDVGVDSVTIEEPDEDKKPEEKPVDENEELIEESVEEDEKPEEELVEENKELEEQPEEIDKNSEELEEDTKPEQDNAIDEEDMFDQDIEVTNDDLQMLAIPILQLQRAQWFTSLNPSKVWIAQEDGKYYTEVLDKGGKTLLEITLHADGTGTISTPNETINPATIEELQSVLNSMADMDEEGFRNMVGVVWADDQAQLDDGWDVLEGVGNDNIAEELRETVEDVRDNTDYFFAPSLADDIAVHYPGLDDEWLQMLHANLLALPDANLVNALRDQNTMNIVSELLSIQDIVIQKNIIWLLFSSELSDFLSGITMDQLVWWVLLVKDENLQSALLWSLLLGRTHTSMLMVGMKKWSEYPDNNISDGNKLTYSFVKNLERKNRVFDTWMDIFSGNKLLSNEFGQRSAMPTDVKNAYLMFAGDSIRDNVKDNFPSQNVPNRKINPESNYAIISKTDGHMYLFTRDHRLVSRKSVLLGKDKSDASFRVHDYPVRNDAGQTVNFNPPDRTPRGLYAIEDRGPKSKIWNYMQFFPKDGQIDYGDLNKNGDRKRTIGIHELYENEYTKRNAAIQSDNVNDKFLSNGCINMHNAYYAEVWDHLGIGSMVYVS